MDNQVHAVLFDLDNTLVNTNSLKEYRESSKKLPLSNEQLNSTKLYPKTRLLLQKLFDENIDLAVVTNSPKNYAHSILEHHKINDFFKCVITYNDVGAEGIKPSPKGINLALATLGINNKNNILFIGDDGKDVNAAYAAGIKPIAPAWASKDFIGQIPAAMLSVQCLTDELNFYNHIDLIAERCANFNTLDIDKKWLYFIPMNKNGEIGAIKKEDINVICLGRYFSQKNELTAKLHEHHQLSQEIYKKETNPTYVAPEYWVDLLSFFINKIPSYIFPDENKFDIITVIPAKKGKNKRLENVLSRINKRIMNEKSLYLPDIFYFVEGAQSLKSLGGKLARQKEIEEHLRVNEKYKDIILNAKILIIDDVITTGSTIHGAINLLNIAGANRVIGIALAKTVSISQEAQICELCGRTMRVQRNSKTGIHFLGCTGYFDTPQCKNRKNIIVKECPQCKSGMYKRPNNKGDLFLACEGFYNRQIHCRHTEDVE